jgi:hypothetical protein
LMHRRPISCFMDSPPRPDGGVIIQDGRAALSLLEEIGDLVRDR